MTIQVVDVFPVKTSLDSQRGVLFEGALILPDTLCPGEVIVRFIMSLSIDVNIVKIGEFEFEYPSDDIDAALKNQVYNTGWFKGLFAKMEEGFGTMNDKKS